MRDERDKVKREALRGREADLGALRIWLSDDTQERVRSYLTRVLGKQARVPDFSRLSRRSDGVGF
jgi:hypothetical protein